MAIYLEPFRSVYVEIPKVACSSMKLAIADLLNIELDGPNNDPHQSTFPWLESSMQNRSLFPELFSFAIVRNPWSRLLSCYRDKIQLSVEGYTNSTIRLGIADCFADYDQLQANMPFSEFVAAIASIPDAEADAHFRSQHTFISNAKGVLAIDFVGRFESLDLDLIEIQRRGGMPKFILPRTQTSGTYSDYQKEYTSTTRLLVEDRFQKDIDWFGYRFSGECI